MQTKREIEPMGDQRLEVEFSLGGERDGQFVVSGLDVK